MAGYTDLWNAVSNAANKISGMFSNPGSKVSNSNSNSTPVVHTNANPNGTTTDSNGVVWKNNGMGVDAFNTLNNAYNTSVANSAPKYDYGAYAQGKINGTIPSNQSIQDWTKVQYPGNNLNYASANGSTVPSTTLTSQDYINGLKQYKQQAQDEANQYLQQQKDLANQQAEANRTSQLARLRTAYDQQRSDINSQIPELETTAQQALTQNENDYYNKYKPQMLAAMEQSGGYKGGQMVDNLQGLITALQNNASNISTDKLNQEAKLKTALANLDKQQASDETQVNSNIDASTYDKIMNALQQSQQNKMTLDQMYNDQAYKNATLGMQQQQLADSEKGQDQNAAMQMAQLKGYVDPHPGLNVNQSVYDLVNKQYGGDYQAAINAANNGQLSRDYLPSLEEARYQKVSSNPSLMQQYGNQYQTIQGQQAQTANTTANLQNQLAQLELQFKQQQYPIELQQLKDQAALDAKYNPQKAALEIQQLNAQIANINANIGLTNAQANNVGASTALGWANHDLNVSNSAVDNAYKQAQTNQLLANGSTDLASEYAWIAANPTTAPAAIQSQATGLIKSYGTATYQKLVEAANQAYNTAKHD